MAGHMMREIPAHTAMHWVPEEGLWKRGGRRRHGEAHSRKTYIIVRRLGARRIANDRTK